MENEGALFCGRHWSATYWEMLNVPKLRVLENEVAVLRAVVHLVDPQGGGGFGAELWSCGFEFGKLLHLLHCSLCHGHLVFQGVDSSPSGCFSRRLSKAAALAVPAPLLGSDRFGHVSGCPLPDRQSLSSPQMVALRS